MGMATRRSEPHDPKQPGIYQLAGLLPSLRLRSAEPFLAAMEVLPGDRATLLRAVQQFGRPTLVETYRAISSFLKSPQEPGELQALNELGQRIGISEGQSRAVSAWWDAFKRVPSADKRLHDSRIDELAADYVQFSDEITRQALDADEETGVDELEATHIVLANIAQWQRLRPALTAIQVALEDRWPEFLNWARSVVPQRAQDLLSAHDLDATTRVS
jgi:hypothetical protein